MGTEPPNMCHHVPSHCSGRRDVRMPFWVVRSARDKVRDVVLTARVPVGLNPLWRSAPSSGRAYLMSELSWRLCVILWWSSYVRQRRDGFHHSSAYGQACECLWQRHVMLGI
jgi:hypothetical protein